MAKKIIKLNKKSIVCEAVKPSLTRVEFEQYIGEAETEIFGFIGGVKFKISDLNNQVPASFPNSTKYDVDNNPSQKTWDEYTIHMEYDADEVLLVLGCRDEKGNRCDCVCDEELRIWVDYFGINKILTKSEFKALIPVEVD